MKTYNRGIVKTMSLPYDPSALKWDSLHLTNKQNRYCYCGYNGEWYRRMLQCCRCRQWFHEACVKCVKVSLFCGDRFFLFVCSRCNFGAEYLKTYQMEWADIVHLVLFHLVVTVRKKNVDIDKEVLPFLNGNWNLLRPTQRAALVSREARKLKMEQILKSSTKRFKAAVEGKKRCARWGLRELIPPPGPTLMFPTKGTINDVTLSHEKAAGVEMTILHQTRSIPVSIGKPRNVLVVERIGSTTPSQRNKPSPISPAPKIGPYPAPSRTKTSIQTKDKPSSKNGTSSTRHKIKKKKITPKRRRLALRARENGHVAKPHSPSVRRARKLVRRSRSPRKTQAGRDKARERRALHTEVTAEITSPPPPQPPKEAKVSKPVKPACMTIQAPSIVGTNGDTSLGTLDSIIPPLQNYRGKNHPFYKETDRGKFPLKVKRKLRASESARLATAQVTAKRMKTDTTTQTVLGGKDCTQNNILKSVQNGAIKNKITTEAALNNLHNSAGKLLMGETPNGLSRYLRSGKVVNKNGNGLFASPHPVKNGSSLNNTSVNGEKSKNFDVIGRRTNSDGLVQYLIKWK